MNDGDLDPGQHFKCVDPWSNILAECPGTGWRKQFAGGRNCGLGFSRRAPNMKLSEWR